MYRQLSRCYHVVEVADLDPEAVDADGDVSQRDVVDAESVVKLVLSTSQQLLDCPPHLLR